MQDLPENQFAVSGAFSVNIIIIIGYYKDTDTNVG